MKNTITYSLPQFESTDIFNKEDFNVAFETIDNELNDIQTVFDGLIINAGNSNAEVVVARGTEVSLPTRLDKVDTRLGKINSSLSDISTLVTKYKIESETNDSDMIDRALASGPYYKNVILPKGEYVTVRPIIIDDGVSFEGVGGATVIKPDFSKWEGTDYRAIIIRGREGINREYKSYNRKIGNFSLIGVNANLVKATGIFFGTDKVISKDVSVNYGFIDGLIENIYVARFDTAYMLKEIWNSDLININCMECREGINIIGKSVNINILCKTISFSNLYTTDVTDSRGIYIASKMDYTDGEGRPEGISFNPGCLIFGAITNVYVNAVLQCTFNNCIIDGAKGKAIFISLPDMVTFRGCYIYSSTTTLPVIDIGACSTYNSKTTFDNCKIVGNGAPYGIYTGQRWNFDFINNDISGVVNPIFANNLFNSKIINNHGKNNTGTYFIMVQSHGNGSVVDGNISDDTCKVLMCHPTTDKSLQIGNNIAVGSQTYMKGRATILANTLSISVTPFGSILNTDYIYPYVMFSLYNDNVKNVKYAQANNVLTFTLDTISVTDTVIYYEISAIPRSSFVA